MKDLEGDRVNYTDEFIYDSDVSVEEGYLHSLERGPAKGLAILTAKGRDVDEVSFPAVSNVSLGTIPWFLS